MREIKFRGKSKDDIGKIEIGDWLYGGIVFDNDRYWIDIPYYGNIIADKDTIGQYTGLKDKNGKEIYEGDKVYIISEDEYGEIKWESDMARFVVIFDNILTDFDNWNGKDLEVVGTIYD